MGRKRVVLHQRRILGHKRLDDRRRLGRRQVMADLGRRHSQFSNRVHRVCCGQADSSGRLDLRQGHQRSTAHPPVGSAVFQDGFHRPRGPGHIVARQVVQPLGLQDPVVGVELLEHPGGGGRDGLGKTGGLGGEKRGKEDADKAHDKARDKVSRSVNDSGRRERITSDDQSSTPIVARYRQSIPFLKPDT